MLNFSLGSMGLLSLFLAHTCQIIVPMYVFFLNLGLLLTTFHQHNSGRVIVADFQSSYHDFRVVCIYAPNQYLVRGPFFEDLDQFTLILLFLFFCWAILTPFLIALLTDLLLSLILLHRDTSDKLT